MNSKGNTIFWAIIACLLWSTAYAGIKLGLQFDTPFHFAGIRFIISGLIILPFTVKPGVFIRMVRENWKVIVWVSVLQFIVNYSLFYQGLNLVPGALGAIIYGSQPLVVAAVAAIFHDDDKWFKLLQRPGVKVSELNLWKFINPVVGAVLSWLLIPNENPEWLTISGMIIITGSLIVFYKSSTEISTN